MPNTKLVFVKMLLELADDTRFIITLNDSQKLDYLLLLLMAGLTNNEIPPDAIWFKSRFHLEKPHLEIEQNIEHIKKTYDKFINHKGKLKFRNFKELHNYVYKEKENSLGILKECYKNTEKLPNIYYIISSLINYYIKRKGYNMERVTDQERSRYGKTIKSLLATAKGNEDEVQDAIGWVADTLEKQHLTWTIETVQKWFPEYLKNKKSDNLKELEGILNASPK